MWPIIAIVMGVVVFLGNRKSLLDSFHWFTLQEKIKGKKIAVLGQRESGKTTLLTFLLKGELPAVYVATVKPEKFSGGTYKLKDLEIKIEDTIDVPGDIDSHADWERLYKEADFVFYLVDANKIHSGEHTYKKKVHDDMRHIGEWLDDRKDKPPQFLLVATHCDLIPEYESLSKKTDFTDVFWKTEFMQTLIFLGRGMKNVKCVAGSLNGKDESGRLVRDILGRVSAND